MLEGLAQREETLSREDRIQLHYTLAKVLEDLGRFDGAFDHLLRGSALKRAAITYDEAGELELMQRIAACFTRERMNALAGAGDLSQAPIFVLGMPRSGTTLVEQIIASHPEVQALGERTEIGDELMESGARSGAHYPELVERLRRSRSARDRCRLPASDRSHRACAHHG